MVIMLRTVAKAVPIKNDALKSAGTMLFDKNVEAGLAGKQKLYLLVARSPPSPAKHLLVIPSQ